MMNPRKLTAAAIVCLSIGIIATDAHESLAQGYFGGGFSPPAQGGFGNPGAQQLTNPVVSPFLNLAQPGVNPAIAYQTIVVPQSQLGNAVMTNQQQIGDLRRSTLSPQASNQQMPSMPLRTGHSAVFLNTYGYFPTVSPRRSGR